LVVVGEFSIHLMRVGVGSHVEGGDGDGKGLGGRLAEEEEN